jgi:hypothetical protein
MTQIKGIEFSPELQQAWKDLKAKKIKGFSMKLSDDLKSIEIDTIANSWEKLISSLPEVKQSILTYQ